jgi:ABC-type uncharacterized transport system substrate-binding protein
MHRRTFIMVLGGATAWPLTARGQQPAVPVIGFLHQASPQGTPHQLAKWRQGLGENGYVEGRSVAIEFRWADGQYDRLPALAADLVRRQVTVIAASLLPAALAAKAATTTIPIVFVSGSDPVEYGLVPSVSRPVGNVTGVSLFTGPLVPKRLELVRELVPGASAIAMLVNPNNPNTAANVRDAEAAASVTGVKLRILKAGSESEFISAFATLVPQSVDVLLVNNDAFFSSQRKWLIALAASHKVPTIYYSREFVVDGGLISYGTNIPDMYYQAGVYVGRILKGAKPGDLPVMQPSKFELVINLKAARSLGLAVPPAMLARADEVVE